MTVEQMAQAKIGELMITNMKMLNALKTQAEEITRLTKIIDDLSEPNLPLDVEGAGASGTASGPPNGTTCGNGIVGGSGGRVTYGITGGSGGRVAYGGGTGGGAG